MQTNAAVAEPMVEKMKKRNETSAADRIRSYLRHPGSGVLALLTIGAAVVTFAVLIFLVAYILVKGIPYLTPSLFSLEYTSENVSLMPSLINTFIMTALSLVIAAPLGIFAAIYLVEYAKKGNKLVQVIRITAETLSGIPSIVYGLFGMLFFVTALHWGMSLLAGACTLVIMVLPLIMRTTEEALKAVPDIIKPNRSELEEYTGTDHALTVHEIIETAENFHEKGIQTVAVSMGKDGAVFAGENYKINCPALPVKAHSTVGAGDAMVAALAYAHDRKLSEKEMVRLCMAVSAGAVTTVGTKPPDRALVEQLMSEVRMQML